MRTIRTSTGAEITLDGDLLAIMETLYHEVTARKALERSFEDMVREIQHLIAQMTDDVAAHVLGHNYDQNVLLSNARAQTHSMLPVHKRFIRWLEHRGELDRALEFLPSDAEIKRRDAAGDGQGGFGRRVQGDDRDDAGRRHDGRRVVVGG